MKKRLLTAAALFVATFAIISCGNSESELDFNQNINVTIKGIVYNQEGVVPLSGVTVTLGDETATTNEDGEYTFENNSTGSYLLRFEREGFATMVQAIQESGREFTANAIVNTSPIFMYEENQTLETRLYIQNGPERNSAANINVRLTLAEDREFLRTRELVESAFIDDGFDSEEVFTEVYFEETIIDVTTDANGNLSVSNLPNTTIQLSVDFVADNYNFTLTAYDRPADFSSSYALDRESVDLFELIETNIVDAEGNAVDNFTASDNITFQFTSAINADFENMSVTLSNGFADVLVDATVSGSLLTIDPLGSALEAGQSYSVSIDIESEGGVGYNAIFSFTIAGGEINLTQVTGLQLETVTVGQFTSVVNISFNDVSDASAYEVYGRYSDGTDEYVQLSTIFNGVNDVDVFLATGGIQFPANGFFVNGATFSIMVRAVNGDLTGAFSVPLTIAASPVGI